MITIITVSYNDATALEQTILNVMAQKLTHKIFYIIVDGASTDNTASILKKYSATIDLCISEKDNGIYDAMNKGWGKANSDSYVLFLGAGDLLINLPDLRLSVPKDADIIYGNVLIGSDRLYVSNANIKLKLGNTVHHQSLLVKKQIHPSPPFSTAFPTYADFDFNQNLLKSGYRFHKLENFVSYAKIDGVSYNFNKTEALAVVSKNFGGFWKTLAAIYYRIQMLIK